MADGRCDNRTDPSWAEPGVWIWRSPHHAHYLVTNTGTHDLGNGAFARRIWRVSAQATQRTLTTAKR